MRYTDDDIRDALLRAIDEAGSLRGYAKRIGLSAAFVSMAARGETPPGPTIATALGFVDDGKRWVRHAKK